MRYISYNTNRYNFDVSNVVKTRTHFNALLKRFVLLHHPEILLYHKGNNVLKYIIPQLCVDSNMNFFDIYYMLDSNEEVIISSDYPDDVKVIIKTEHNPDVDLSKFVGYTNGEFTDVFNRRYSVSVSKYVNNRLVLSYDLCFLVDPQTCGRVLYRINHLENVHRTSHVYFINMFDYEYLTDLYNRYVNNLFQENKVDSFIILLNRIIPDFKYYNNIIRGDKNIPFISFNGNKSPVDIYSCTYTRDFFEAFMLMFLSEGDILFINDDVNSFVKDILKSKGVILFSMK